jgi:hypothetical protein
MTSGGWFSVIAAGAWCAALLLCACGGDEPDPSPAAGGSGGAANGAGSESGVGVAGEPTPLVALMRELDAPWSAALLASGWLEAPDVEGAAATPWIAQLEQAHAQVQKLLADPRFAPNDPALGVVFGAMKDGLGATFGQWSAAASTGDVEALRRARAAVETSCVACHRSMRDDDPAKLATSMRRWETLHLRLREQALAIEAAPGDRGRLAQMAADAGELAVMADSGILRPLPGAPPEHAALRASFQKAAEALRLAAEKRDAAAAILAFGPVGYGCLTCHEARNVRPRAR